MAPEDGNANLIDTTISQGTAVQTHDVLGVKGLRKTYESEGVPVRALRGVDSLYELTLPFLVGGP